MLLTNSHANNISWHELFIYCKTSFVLLKLYTNLTKKFLVERGVEPRALRLLSVALYHTAMKLTKYSYSQE